MPALGSPILLDGSHGEGGGALIRAALVMSALTQQPVRIDNVRGGTKYPGLDYEDVLLIRALAQSTAAEVIGVEVGNTTVSFLPTRRAHPLNENLDLPEDETLLRGASAPVVMNALLPVLGRTGAYSSVSLSGETYGHRSLGFDYFESVTIPALRKLGLYAFPDQELAGFGRESRGRLTMDVEPSAIQALDWSTRGKLVSFHGMVTTAELASSVGERGCAHLEKLAESAKLPIEVQMNPVDARSAGAFVTVWAEFERGIGGATSMGQRGIKMETLAQTAFEDMLDWLSGDATVDPFLADQLLIPACLAEGETTFRTSRLTQRFTTSVWVIKQFLPIHVTVRGADGEPGVITIRR